MAIACASTHRQDVNNFSSFKKIGILGGTFNPVHFGHLLIAESALNQFGLEQVIWVPAYAPPHKSQRLLAFSHRWTMVQQAIADHPNFVACDVEQQQTPSYASNTFASLQKSYPQTHWHWIIGSDTFQTLAGWHQIYEFAATCTWLIAVRGQTALTQIAPKVMAEFAACSVCLQWHELQMPQIQTSSSLIRQYCQEGRSLRYLIPEAVRVYIDTNNLYSKI